MEEPGFFPWLRSSSGFGSKVSTAEGPPSMNSQMTDLALAGKWTVLGAIGLGVWVSAANGCSRPKRSLNASIPNPAPAACRNRRRLETMEEVELARVRFSYGFMIGQVPDLVDVKELIESEKDMAKVGHGAFEILGAQESCKRGQFIFAGGSPQA